MVLKNEKWEKLVLFVSNQFGSGEKLDLQAILFLIGILKCTNYCYNCKMIFD